MPSENNIPGQLSPQAYAESIEIYREEFPKDKISDGDLRIRAMEVLRLFALLVRPEKGEDKSDNGNLPK